MALRFLNSGYFAGKVGIGTESPSSTLTIATPAPNFNDSQNAIRLEYVGGASPNDIGPGIVFAQKWWSTSLDTQATGGIYGVKNGADGAYGGGLVFYTQPNGSADMNQHMIINSSGNVGIGTTSPEAKLDVRSDSRTAPVVLKLGNGIISGDNGVIVSQIRSYINNSNTDADELARIQVENGSGSHDDGNLSFWTRDGLNNVDAAKQLQIGGRGVIDIKNDGTALLPVLIFGADVDTGFYRPSANNIALSTSGEERIRVISGGNVGIGTTQPGANLDVRHDAGGTVRIGTDTNNIGEDAAFGTLEFYNGDTSNSGPGVTAMIQAKTYNQYSTGGDITFSNKIYPSSTISERMRIDSSGKVGIGTDNPSATLELNSDTGNAAKLKVGRQNGVTNYLELGTSGGSSVINAIGIAGVNADLIFNRSTTTATTQSMIINGSGNVGIGTSNFADMSWASPALKLLGSRAGLGLYSTGALATLAFTSNADGTKAVHINQASSGKISFYQYSQGGETLTLDNTGFLGVNTTLPSARLHVTGTAKITDLPYSPFGEMVTVSSAGQLTKKTSSSGGNYFADMSFGESYISNYKSRVLDYNGTYFPTAAASNVANHKANNLFNLITMMLLPGGVFTGKITAAKPKSGVDFAWTRTTVANYTDEEGVIQEAAIATPRIDYANNSNGEILIEPTRTNLVPNSGPGDYGNGPGSSTTVPGPNGVYDSAIVPVPDATADRYQYAIPSGTYSNGDVFTYSWYKRRLSTPVQATYVGDLSIQGLVNCSLTGATAQIESNISGFDRFACEITLTLANTTALVRGYFGAIVGIGNSSVAYFGQQLELGDFATTLINTTGSAVTRDNDYMIVNNLSSTIFQGMVGQGGFYMDFDYKREGNADGLRFYDENNITPRVYLYQGVTGISDSWNAGSFTLNQTSGNKIGYMFTSTTSAVYCANGSNIVTSSPTAAQALDTPLDTIYIDGNQNLVRIRELSMFTQMTSAQLVTLTTS